MLFRFEVGRIALHTFNDNHSDWKLLTVGKLQVLAEISREPMFKKRFLRVLALLSKALIIRASPRTRGRAVVNRTRRRFRPFGLPSLRSE